MKAYAYRFVPIDAAHAAASREGTVL